MVVAEMLLEIIIKNHKSQSSYISPLKEMSVGVPTSCMGPGEHPSALLANSVIIDS